MDSQPSRPCALPLTDLKVTWNYPAFRVGTPTEAVFTAHLKTTPGPWPIPAGQPWWEVPEQPWPADSPLAINPGAPTFSATIFSNGPTQPARMSIRTQAFAASDGAYGGPGTYSCDPASFFITFLFSQFGIGRFVVGQV